TTMSRRRAAISKPRRVDSPPGQPNPNEQSGSAGRATPADATQQRKDTGQGRYGQSGYADGHDSETDGEAKYRDSEKDGDPRSKKKSNEGSGLPSADETTKDI